LYLDRHPALRSRLRSAPPELMRTAVEEFLRYFTPVQRSGRNLTLHGRDLAEGRPPRSSRPTAGLPAHT